MDNNTAFAPVLESGENAQFPDLTPLALIGGSQTPNLPTYTTEGSYYSILDSCFFDWYQCSISESPENIVRIICEEMGAARRPIKPQSPYLYGLEFFPANEMGQKNVTQLCQLYYGGINDKSTFKCTSDQAILGSEFVRKHFPIHGISRIDVALDFCEGPGFFDGMANWLISYAGTRKLKTTFYGDWANATQGRTLEVGSRKSPVMIRLYEKGIEQMVKGNSGAPADWVRFEAEIKPGTGKKVVMSTKTPAQCFGTSRMLRDFLDFLTAENVEPINIGTVRKMTDFDRTLAHMAYQYGDTLTELLEQNGGDPTASFLELLRIAEHEKQKRAQARELLGTHKANFSLFPRVQVLPK